MNAHPENPLQLLRDRLLNGRPATDTAQLHLVLGGGGQRGAYSGGFVTGLYTCGALPLFDKVVVTSTGAYVAAWLLAGDPALGTTMYMEENVSPQFISRRRVPKLAWDTLRGRLPEPVLNLNYILEDALVHRKPLNFAALCDTPVPLVCVACDADTGDTVCLSDFATPADVSQSMRATASVPIWSGRPVAYRGRRLVDGCLKHNLPVRVARQLGATHVLAVSNFTAGYQPMPAQWWDRLLVRPESGASLPRLIEYQHRHDEEELTLARTDTRVTLFENPFTLAADEKDTRALWRAAQAGFREACALFDRDCIWPETWTSRPSWPQEEESIL